MTIETEIAALTTSTTALLATSAALKDDTAALIAEAVIVSVNSTQIPLVAIATNMINTQTLFVNYVK
jgi:hypothetical protein